MSVYYVDDDADAGGDGTTQALTGAHCAWDTVADVTVASFNAGDFILFNRGDEWRERLNISSSGTAGVPVTYGAYGTGDRPILNGCDLVTTWGDASPPANSWSASVTTEPLQVYFDGVLGTHVAAEANLANAREWFWGSNVLCVYSTSDPDTAYVAPGIEAGRRGYCIYATNKDNWKVTGLHLKYSNTLPLYATAGCENVEIEDCIIECGTTSGIEINAATNFSLHDSIIRNNPNDGIWSNTSTNTSIYSNTFTNNGFHATTGDRNAIGVWQSPGCSIYLNTITHSSSQDAIECGADDDSTTLSIYSNWIDCSGGTGMGILCMNGEYEIYYNVIIGNASNEGIMLASDDADYLVAHVYNNVLYGWDESIECYDNNAAIHADTEIIIKNNISSVVNTRHIRVENNIDAATTLDNNCYDSDTGTQYQWNDTDYNFADYLTNSSQDANAVQDDPLFTTAGSVFTLQITSPCINAGTNVGLTGDYTGNIVGALPDIGAYEKMMTQGRELHQFMTMNQT